MPKINPSWYYRNNKFLKFLRFINVLEPDKHILSVSKILSWIMLFVVIYVLILMPENLPAIISAVGGLMATLLNYSYRRWVQYQRDQKHLDDNIINDEIEDEYNVRGN